MPPCNEPTLAVHGRLATSEDSGKGPESRQRTSK